MSSSEALAGFLAGVINDTILFHPDNLKYIKQNNFQSRPLTLSTIPYHSRGAGPIIFGGGLSYAAYFYSYGLCKTTVDPLISRLITKTDSYGEPIHTPMTKTIIAAVSGALAILPSTLVSFPFDTLKKHISVLPDLSARQVADKIYHEGGGFKGFYFGWNYTLSRDIYMSALKMAIFEGFSKILLDCRNKDWYRKILRSTDNNDTNNDDSKNQKSSGSTLEASLLSPREVTFAGLLSGTLTGFVSTPVDCVVSRIRSPITPPEAKRGFLTCAKWMIQQEPENKIKPFFRGAAIRTTNYAVGSTVFWGLFATFQKRAEVMLNPNRCD